jgi:LmbE family N-acetylglucosaminyl deacetylase
MMRLHVSPDSTYKVLCLGAHSDDIEIGCGGSILRLTAANRNLLIYWVVFSANEPRSQEAMASANLFLAQAAEKKIAVNTFRDGFFPFVGAQIKDYFEHLKQQFTPDMIFTHYRNDLHQDHRLISDLTWNTFRNHLILEYEIPKYDGDLGTPNFFIHLDEDVSRQKVRYLLDSFQTQRGKHWFTEDTFMSILRIRGIEAGGPARYAEAFYSRKMTW